MAELRPGLALRFQRRFLAARPLRSLPWAELEQSLRTAPDSALLADILHNLESTAAEPLDELYEALADVLKEEEPTHCYKNYLLPTGDCVSLSESTALISGGTTGLVTWEAALLLAQWALQNPAVFRDRQLGENIQLNGFIPEPDVPWSIRKESQGQEVEGENCQNPKVIVAELDWGSVTEKQLLGLRADVVIAAGNDIKFCKSLASASKALISNKADVVYDPEIILALIGMLQKLSTCRADRRAPEVFIASTIRNPDTYQLFQAELVLERSRSIVQEQALILELDLRVVAFAHGFHQELGTHL
ncbi:eukaryotic elongation factor 2 lysine methyltransferase [Turdus rufiventris]|nr:eukaryotic elongation factor 2 lysine methyltransferase [Turdus rufiventris]